MEYRRAQSSIPPKNDRRRDGVSFPYYRHYYYWSAVAVRAVQKEAKVKHWAVLKAVIISLEVFVTVDVKVDEIFISAGHRE